jgi:hypothetical protein
VSRRWAVAGVVQAPADEVFARLCAIGPAGSGQLAGPPGSGTTTGTDGVLRYTALIGQPPVTTVTVQVDPTRRTLAVQGHWWYRGVHMVTPHPRGSLLAYRVHNVASRGRWMVPLMQWRLPRQMRRDLDQLLVMLGQQLRCAAYRLADSSRACSPRVEVGSPATGPDRGQRGRAANVPRRSSSPSRGPVVDAEMGGLTCRRPDSVRDHGRV